MVREESAGTTELAAYLPNQPAAAKLEYSVRLWEGNDEVTLPHGGTAVIRYRGEVPAWVLIPHIITMFFTLWIVFRAALGAVFGEIGVRRFIPSILGFLLFGGFFLGPLVQKYAFDDWWTGVPFGWDLTDNKTLVMWFAWFFALLAIGRGAKRDATDGGSTGEKKARLAVVLAAIVTVAVYLIPHSMAGSQLDYEAVDRGVAPEDAIGIG